MENRSGNQFLILTSKSDVRKIWNVINCDTSLRLNSRSSVTITTCLTPSIKTSIENSHDVRNDSGEKLSVLGLASQSWNSENHKKVWSLDIYRSLTSAFSETKDPAIKISIESLPFKAGFPLKRYRSLLLRQNPKSPSFRKSIFSSYLSRHSSSSFSLTTSFTSFTDVSIKNVLLPKNDSSIESSLSVLSASKRS